MPYGPEVSPDERDGKVTIDERGLHIVCYQSSIVRGFKFIQQGRLINFASFYFLVLICYP